ncbi:hypothetical protein M409DRAFT_56802 [Zasmidium cellare ATCC 36951]|uniref:Uncharacterized protein n=1 Tax=Zasmidium cellare ATCC 36951 TaxID=1080233 RepID=A0A6A6CDU0_ZASCE|nr:uncharacterized protein M409DRAFT_56802 [Zasmidium cellare ATCC 36951]KAF2164082.1 hypothetical protein M409DRAFT_56802 [Zasmidium cellare ATCC 36951]
MYTNFRVMNLHCVPKDLSRFTVSATTSSSSSKNTPCYLTPLDVDPNSRATCTDLIYRSAATHTLHRGQSRHCNHWNLQRTCRVSSQNRHNLAKKKAPSNTSFRHGPHGRKPELPGERIEHHHLASAIIHELDWQPKPNETKSRAAPMDKEVEWVGWEAPALVEVDMSRPPAASTNGGNDHHDRLPQLARQPQAQGRVRIRPSSAN